MPSLVYAKVSTISNRIFAETQCVALSLNQMVWVDRTQWVAKIAQNNLVIGVSILMRWTQGLLVDRVSVLNPH